MPDLDPGRETPTDRTTLAALRRLGARATVGDVVAGTGLAQREAVASLRRVLESRKGHMEVGEGGTLVYRFDPRLVRRDEEPLWRRLERQARAAFQQAFKLWIVLILVVYFFVFGALLIAALVAGQNRDQGGGGWRGRGTHHHRHGHFPSFWIWYLVWSPGWGWGRPYYGHRWEKRQGREARVPLYKKVFAFVFGPDRPRPTRAQRDRSVVRLIRARRGVLTALDLVRHTGFDRTDADDELARLMVAYEGDVRVSGEGELVYVFPELMVSAHGGVREQLPDPAWRRLEPPLALTGNGRGTDALVGSINGFNMLAAASAPWIIFPKTRTGGDVGMGGSGLGAVRLQPALLRHPSAALLGGPP